jgi:hypothetical protein
VILPDDSQVSVSLLVLDGREGDWMLRAGAKGEQDSNAPG